MPEPDRKQRAGPLGRAHLSRTLMRRPQGDPNQFRNAAVLATNRRTSRGSEDLVLDYTGVPLVVEDQLRLVVAKVNELIANDRVSGLREKGP